MSLQNCKNSKNDQKENIYHNLFTTHKAGNKELYSTQKPWQERIYPLDEVHKDFILQMNLLDNFTINFFIKTMKFCNFDFNEDRLYWVRLVNI